jgi:outer membrane protein TolC
VREARTSLESERFTLRKTDADNAQTLAEDYRSYRDAIENAGVVAQLLEANQLRVKIADAQYRNGLISFQDFDTITNSSISQQQTELQTRRDAVLAEAKWEESQGRGDIP